VTDDKEMTNVYHNILKNSLTAYEARKTPLERRQVTVTTGVEGNSVVIEFSDEAGGIPDEDLDRVFAPSAEEMDEIAKMIRQYQKQQGRK
jgi:sensor histidine kinase regulating citrate/malate metabolism